MAQPPIQVHLRSEESGGKLSLTELTMAAGSGGPPLHVHPKHGEGFYVLDGELAFRVGDELLRGLRGTFAFAPAGTPHTLANLSSEDARLLVMCVPAGFERYFEQLAQGRFGDPPAEEAVAVGPPIGAEGGRPSGVA